jgi:uncharacterized protein
MPPRARRRRKEPTGALDDAQLRVLEERLRYLLELDERRIAILDSIRVSKESSTTRLSRRSRRRRATRGSSSRIK